MVPLVLWTSLAMMGLCADVLPPGAEPVYPGHAALCQATPGEGEGPRPPAHLNPNMGLGDAETLHGPMTLNTQNPVSCTVETTPVLGSSHIWFFLPCFQVLFGLALQGFLLMSCPALWDILGPPQGPGILSLQPVPLTSKGVYLNFSKLFLGSQRPLA